MSAKIIIAVAQINPTVGDLSVNIKLIDNASVDAAKNDADLVLLPEMCLTGYPAEDLLLKQSFQDYVIKAVNELALITANNRPALIIGAPWIIDNQLYNCSILLADGKINTIRAKYQLPNYGVFDEKRLFSHADINTPSLNLITGAIDFKCVKLGLMTCEDMWCGAVSQYLKGTGAEILLICNASPFEIGKSNSRIKTAKARVNETGLPLIYVNQIGGQDETIFDGGSFVINSDLTVARQLPYFESHMEITIWHNNNNGKLSCDKGNIDHIDDRLEAIYKAVTLGLRDYVNKNGFSGVVIGMSGGIDSALSAAIAVDALGKDNVHCVMMPSPYTSEDSLKDADIACQILGVKLDKINIKPAMDAFSNMLSPVFNDKIIEENIDDNIDDNASNIAFENIQARSRGLILMAISNKYGKMLLTTGNKSELAVGYATLYGDMCGGYNVLKDIYKMDVFALSKMRNKKMPSGMGLLGHDGAVMPDNIMIKAPSAELRPDQTDQDSLPPYEILDDILESLIEKEMSLQDIVKHGHKPELVKRIWHMLDLSEYKRKQAPLGAKVSVKSFGKDRRYPITNGFRKNL